MTNVYLYKVDYDFKLLKFKLQILNFKLIFVVNLGYNLFKV